MVRNNGHDLRRPFSGGEGALPWIFVVGAIVGIAFFVAPLLSLIVRAPWGDLTRQLSTRSVRDALVLSAEVSLCSLAISLLLGVPLAWAFARLPFPGKRLLRALVIVPMVLPPVVAGVGLLEAFGRAGVLGGFLSALHISLPFTTAGAVVASSFVAAPFMVVTVEAALAGVDKRLEDAAATLGATRATILRTITLPAIAPSLAAGAALSWARALGEFGATITFAGNFPRVTQTTPLAVYQLLQTNPDAAVMLSLVLMAISLAVIVALRGNLRIR
jgi:molybdate transport system permease protein